MRKFTLSLLFGLCFILNTRGQTITQDGVNYTVYYSNERVKVTASPEASGEITIPNTIEIGETTYPVYLIDEKAFQNNTAITSVTIGDNVTSIGNYAFSGCAGLEKVTVGKAIKQFGYEAFGGCKSLNAVYYTGTLAQWCGISAYNNNVNANPLSAAHNLYIDGRIVTEAAIPADVSVIESCAFINATCLQGRLTLPASITQINTSAFQGCSGLTGVDYQGTLEQWLKIKFSGTGSNPLTSTHNLYIGGNLLTSLTIPESISTIPYAAFQGASCLTGTLQIPSTVTKMDSYAFADCTGLTSVTLGDGLTTVPYGAFQRCTGLQSVKGGASVTKFDSYAFKDCSNLQSVAMPPGLTSIASYCFENCSSLADALPLPETLTSIGVSAFASCKSLKGDLVIPESVTTLGTGSFDYCESLTSLKLNNTITEYGSWSSVFRGCSGLSGQLVIPDCVKSLGNSMFASCTGIRSVVIGNSLTSLNSSLFLGCSAMEEITIGPAVTSMMTSSLGSCKGLKKITSLAEVPPTAYSSTFSGIDTSIPVFVPKGTVAAYKAKSYWSNFINITDGEAVTGIVILKDGVDVESAIAAYVNVPFSLSAGIAPEGVEATVTWSLNNTNVASLVQGQNNTVTINPLQTGTTVITASSLGVNASATITVNPVMPLSLTVSAEGTESTELKDGQTLQLNVTFNPANTTNQNVTWTTDNPKMASVSTNGLVTAGAVTGNVTVKATSEADDNICGEISLKIIPTPVGSVSVTVMDQAASTTLRDGETLQLVADILPLTATDKILNWESSDTAIAIVSDNGLVTARQKTGTALVTATATDGSGVSGEIEIIVEPTPVTSITLNSSSIELKAKGSFSLNATVLPENATYPELKWETADDNIATVDDEGTVTAVAVGETQITVSSAAYPEISSKCTVKVIETEAESVVIVIPDSTSTAMRYGDTIQLTVKIAPDDVTSKKITWTSSNELVASVDSTGLVTANALTGEAVITATASNGVNANVVVVNNPFIITYNIDNDQYAVQKYGFGETIHAPETPVKEGYTFGGWTALPETMPAMDLTVTGAFEINSYTASFYIDNELFESYAVEYGATIPTPEVNIPNGKTFSGWTPEIPVAMPAEDMDFYGLFSDNASIESISIDESIVSVYSSTGILIAKNKQMKEAFEHLSAGFYIVVCKDGSRVIRYNP